MRLMLIAQIQKRLLDADYTDCEKGSRLYIELIFDGLVGLLAEAADFTEATG